MNFITFKQEYLKIPVKEYPNNREGKSAVVAIKIITYNHVKYIRECLESVLNQKTTFDYEILIAEDDSSDGTKEICIEYAKKYPDKIKLLLNSRENNIYINNKPTGIFNNAYANYNLNSKYSCLLEGDDYWTDEYSLQKRVDFLESNEDYVMCFHDMSIMEEDKILHPNGFFSYKKNTEIKQKDMINISMPTCTLMIRNHLVNDFEEDLKEIICGDLVSRGKLSRFGKSMFLRDVGVSIYRRHKGGIFSSKNISYKVEHAIKAHQYLYDLFKKEKYVNTYAGDSLVESYIMYFIKTIKENKKLDFNLLKNALNKSKEFNTSFFSILFKYLFKRIKR